MPARTFSTVRLNIVLVGFLVLASAAAVSAQTTGIAGEVKDATGAALPGVTVEAASPALIERVRTVNTDGQGLYRIVDLRPGVYTVTFTLPGFSTVRREGVALTASFTATVDADLKVGALEETLTVSAQAPAIDIHNVVQQKVITREVFDSLPSARNFSSFAQTIPAVVPLSVNRAAGQDVGGLSGERAKLVVHGSRISDFAPLLDGLNQGVHTGGGSNQGYTANPAEVEEFSFELGGLSAESPYGGPRLNQIPKSGGNTTTAFFLGNFSTTGMSSGNLDDNLKNRGLTSVNRVKRLEDLNPAIGGPIAQDKLWYFTSYRYYISDSYVAGMYYAKDPTSPVYVQDTARPAIEDLHSHSVSGRLTYQATKKDKLSGYFAWQPACNCHYTVSGLRTPEASIYRTNNTNLWGQVTWKSPVTNRILLEGGLLLYQYNNAFDPQPDLDPNTVSITDSSGLIYRANSSYNTQNYQGQDAMAALSYVTGSHAFKVGMDFINGWREFKTLVLGDMTLQTTNFAPSQVTIFNTPRYTRENLDALLGIYVQDQWTFRRMTLNGGLRFDHLKASIPAEHAAAGRFVPARDYPAVDNVPNWSDLSPRVGIAYDLFGNGKTALKVTGSRYVISERLDLAGTINPASAAGSATRSWTNDVNGNFLPDCDFTNFAANQECGAMQNTSFGSPTLTTRYDDAVRTGWGVRPYNWEVSAGVQHEFFPRLSANASYFRRWYGNFFVTDNQNWTPADFSPYCVTAPVDSRLPGGGGNQICGLYDINPAKSALVDNVITSASRFGDSKETYNGVDLTTSLRLPRGAFVSAGVNTGTFGLVGNTGQNSIDRCLVVDSPRPGYESNTPQAQGSFCTFDMPWLTQLRVSAMANLPWDFQVSGTFMSNPPAYITATYTISNSQALGLGRNLAAGRATIELVQPGTLFGDRVNQFDTRVSRVFRIGPARLKGALDLFNLFNANPVLVSNISYSTTGWQRPTYVLPGRLVKLGIQVDF